MTFDNEDQYFYYNTDGDIEHGDLVVIFKGDFAGEYHIAHDTDNGNIFIVKNNNGCYLWHSIQNIIITKL